MGKYLTPLLVLVVLFVGSVSFIYAQNPSSLLPFRSRERVVLEENESINRDFFAAGDRVEIKGTVSGDLYAAGGNIVVDGVVGGDVLAAGGQIEINGRVDGDVRAVGGTIDVNGTIGKSLTVGAGDITVDSEASISGSMVVGAGNVKVDGPVGGNIVGGVGNLLVRSTVGGNIYAGVGQFQMEKGAGVSGDIVYWSDVEASIDQNATVSGMLERRETPERLEKKDTDSFVGGFKLLSLLSMLAIGLLILRFFPGVLETGTQILEQKPWASLGLGLLKLILIPIISVILFITVLGMPLGIFLFFLYLMELYFATYFVVFWIGKFLTTRFNQKVNKYWVFVIGVLVFALITIVPVVSGLVRFFSLLFGLGALLLLKWSWYQRAFGKK